MSGLKTLGKVIASLGFMLLLAATALLVVGVLALVGGTIGAGVAVGYNIVLDASLDVHTFAAFGSLLALLFGTGGVDLDE